MGEDCDWFNTKCLSPFSLCRGTCQCFEVFKETDDGRCKLPMISHVGEACDAMRKCLEPAVCQNGRCTCVPPFRELHDEEFWLNPISPTQCHNISYSIRKLKFFYCAVLFRFFKCNEKVRSQHPQ